MKKNKLSRVLTGLLALVFTVSMGKGAFAARGTLAVEPGVTLYEEGGKAAFRIQADEGTDLFQDFKGVMPGDVLTQTVTLRAAGTNQNSYRVFLYARECGQAENGGIHVRPGTDKEVLENIELYVYQVDGENRTLISKGLKGDIGNIPGAIGEEAAVEAGARLGTLDASDEVTLEVELRVNINAGNEFANKAAYIDWVFYADTVPDEPGPGPSQW